jgi:protease-4
VRLSSPSRRAAVAAVAVFLAESGLDAEELGDAIRMLRSNGKKVICHLEDAAGRSLYVCAQADRVVMNPDHLLSAALLLASFGGRGWKW